MGWALDAISRDVARSRDAVRGRVVMKIGAYEIVEGAGPDGGYWFAGRRDGKMARFKSKQDAEEHAYLEQPGLDSTGDGKGPLSKSEEQRYHYLIRKAGDTLESREKNLTKSEDRELDELENRASDYPSEDDGTAFATDPPASEAQRRAMGAAMSGHSNLGIPKSVGKEFIGADPGGKLPERTGDAASFTITSKRVQGENVYFFQFPGQPAKGPFGTREIAESYARAQKTPDQPSGVYGERVRVQMPWERDGAIRAISRDVRARARDSQYYYEKLPSGAVYTIEAAEVAMGRGVYKVRREGASKVLFQTEEVGRAGSREALEKARNFVRSQDGAVNAISRDVRARDHWLVEKRYSQGWVLLVGAGTNGGQWAARGRNETAVFNSRRDAEEHIELSLE